MKFTIERGTFLKSLGHVQSVVERRNTIPILSNVQIEAAGGSLSLTATDLDLSIVDTVETEIGEPGATTVPAQTIFDIVRKLPDGAQIELSLGDNQKLSLSAGRSRFTLSCLPKDDFPVMSGGELPHRFKVNSEDIKKLIDKTRFAISTEETRYYLNGIYIHVTDGDKSALRAVATDGHRLAQVEIATPEGAVGMPGVIIPRKTVGELRKILEEFSGDLSISLSDTKIRFEFDGTILTSKLIDGTFPDYTRVIPEGNDKVLELNCHMFAEAVDRVSTISTDRTRSVKIALEKDKIILSVTSPENGTATEEVAATYSAENMEVGFNAKYLLDILNQIGGDVVKAEMADPASPTILRDGDDEDALYVLMPMRV
ncbi:MAG: DNA polymerase III subunit beta [Sphingomonadales bacterium]